MPAKPLTQAIRQTRPGRHLLPLLPGSAGGGHARHRRHLRPGSRPAAALAVQRLPRHALLRRQPSRPFPEGRRDRGAPASARGNERRSPLPECQPRSPIKPPTPPRPHGCLAVVLSKRGGEVQDRRQTPVTQDLRQLFRYSGPVAPITVSLIVAWIVLWLGTWVLLIHVQPAGPALVYNCPSEITSLKFLVTAS